MAGTVVVDGDWDQPGAAMERRQQWQGPVTLAAVRKQVVLYKSYAEPVRAWRSPYTGSGDGRWHCLGGKWNKEQVAHAGWTSAVMGARVIIMETKEHETGPLAWINGSWAMTMEWGKEDKSLENSVEYSILAVGMATPLFSATKNRDSWELGRCIISHHLYSRLPVHSY